MVDDYDLRASGIFINRISDSFVGRFSDHDMTKTSCQIGDFRQKLRRKNIQYLDGGLFQSLRESTNLLQLRLYQITKKRQKKEKV